MNILINASNACVGGGVQVADSICRELYKFPTHQFTVVLSDYLKKCATNIEKYPNVTVVHYGITSRRKKIPILITGRDTTLDSIVKNNAIDAVLTIFGLSLWIPRCLHICGFARGHFVLKDSPYWKRRVNLYRKIKRLLYRMIVIGNFKRSANIFYTENQFITDKLKELFKNAEIYTVTNYYNNIFDTPELWDRSSKLPFFDGLTLLTISANYEHKNLPIIIPTIHYLKRKYPFLKFRFVLTIQEKEFIPPTEEERKYILFLGAVNINQCPILYEQSDIMLLPTLMECFSASYAEAMRMGIPILTTDLGFAHSLCNKAAMYYSPESPEALADAINQLATNKELCTTFIEEGYKQLQSFDTYVERAAKLINIVEKEYQKQNKATCGEKRSK
ncbi:MAG: glycosyltransferase [Bacteroides sp.]|nr:glycosyltransferase [Bacteroides sp.]